VSSYRVKLNLPQLPLRIRKEKEGEKIFDPVRKKWLLLTPEEWVRQNFLLFMHHVHHYPLSLTETEKHFQLFNTNKRADIVFNTSNLKPRIIVECKAPSIKLDKEVFDQVINYHMAIEADFLIITNGLEHYIFQFKKGKVKFLENIPLFEKIHE
jgi:hypothetical protein